MFGSPIRTLHFELTSRCTLACSRCPRNYEASSVSVQDIDVTTFRRSITRANFPFVEHVLLCGSFGDPIYHRDFHKIIAHLKAEGFIVRLNTNGSYRSRPWWARTAAILTRSDIASFSIDGLEDTNAIYRVNARWDDIMVGVAALRGFVRLRWKFIVFSHNQHQIESASERAVELGFDEFLIVRSDRFGGRWKNADGEDPMQPAEDWVSTRLASLPAIREYQYGRR